MKYTDELDKVSYSLGLSIASNLISSGVTTINAEAFIDGLNVVFSGKMPEIMPDEANNILQDYFDKLQQAKGKEAKAEGEKFLAENKKKEGVVALPSGLQYEVIKKRTNSAFSLICSITCFRRCRICSSQGNSNSLSRAN